MGSPTRPSLAACMLAHVGGVPICILPEPPKSFESRCSYFWGNFPAYFPLTFPKIMIYSCPAMEEGIINTIVFVLKNEISFL